MRVLVTLVCAEPGCGSAYSTRKNKKNTTEKIKLKKYCKFCRKSTVHQETK
ncbi:MAG: 50S ribosomal protein L33 [Candidatus Margulisiibacteriota bacterium]